MNVIYKQTTRGGIFFVLLSTNEFCKYLINRDKKGGYISTKLYPHQLFPIYINY